MVVIMNNKEMLDFLKQWAIEHPAQIKEAVVNYKTYSNGFCGEAFTLYVKVKGERKERLIYLQGDKVERGRTIKQGDTISIKKQLSCGYTNKFEYSLNS